MLVHRSPRSGRDRPAGAVAPAPASAGVTAADTTLAAMPGRRGRRWGPRSAILGLVIALLLGVYTGLARGGIEHRFAAAELHALVMVLGFFGTLAALVQSARLSDRTSGRLRGPIWHPGWGRAARVGAVSTVIALPVLLVAPTAGGILLLGGGAVVVAGGLVLARRHREPPLAAIGGAAWVLAVATWLTGSGPVRITPLLAAFLVPTVVAWRLEATPGPTRGWYRWLTAAAGVMLVGGLGVALGWRPAVLAMAVGVLAFAVALWSLDVSWRRWRERGPEGFAARASGAAQLWLVAAAVLWAAIGVGTSGALLHDAAVHALFLGGVTSLVMAGTPDLLERAGVGCHLGAVAEAPLALLHLSVTARVAADLAGSPAGRELALHGNTAALLGFVVVVLLAVRRSGRPMEVTR